MEVDAEGVVVSVTGGGEAHPTFVVSLIMTPGVPSHFLFDNGLYNNVNGLHWQSFALSSNASLDLLGKEGCLSSVNRDIVGVTVYCVGMSIVGDNGLMDEEKRLDHIVVSSCIFLEDESAERTLNAILAKVSG